MDYPFIDGKEMTTRFGYSAKTLQRRRKDVWQRGLHYVKDGNGWKYNVHLIEHLVQCDGDLAIHQRAIEQYQASVEGNQVKHRRTA